jgi:phosphoribosyl-ATP pyrophosphohydrolase
MPDTRFEGEVLERLFAVIRSRRGADPTVSYTARLFAKGRPKIAKKFGEEAVEVVIAALVENRQRLAAESADLLYHLLVLWVEAGVDPQEVWAEISRREGVSGLVEKAGRAGDGEGDRKT